MPDEDQLKEKEGLNNALVNGTLPYEMEMVTGGYRQFDAIQAKIK